MRVSGCMITKNEEEFLDASISSFIDHVDELIIVDDCSQDGTLEIIKSWMDRYEKVKLITGRFNGDKKLQRNTYLELATGDWIFCPDGDEVYTKEQMEILSDHWRRPVQNYIFLNIRLLNFWKDFRHTIHGAMWDGIMCRSFRFLPGVRHHDTHHTVSLRPGVILSKYAQANGQMVELKDFRVPHYSYCKKGTQIMDKIAYYMKRDNPNVFTDEGAVDWARKHPYWSENYDHLRYGEKGLYCCGTVSGRKDVVQEYRGEHPQSIKDHRLWSRLGEYVIGMNEYMVSHWQYHNHLDHPRHQRRIIFAANHCMGHTLEVGCANGYSTNLMTSEYACIGAKFSGVEATDWGFGRAKTNYPDLQFWKAYGENMPFPDGFFDTVLLPEIIEHCADPRALVDEAWRVARKRVIITHPINVRGMKSDPTHLRYYSKEMMEEFAKPYGKMQFTALNDQGHELPKMTSAEYEIHGYFGFTIIDQEQPDE